MILIIFSLYSYFYERYVRTQFKSLFPLCLEVSWEALALNLSISLDYSALHMTKINNKKTTICSHMNSSLILFNIQCALHLIRSFVIVCSNTTRTQFQHQGQLSSTHTGAMRVGGIGLPAVGWGECAVREREIFQRGESMRSLVGIRTVL